MVRLVARLAGLALIVTVAIAVLFGSDLGPTGLLFDDSDEQQSQAPETAIEIEADAYGRDVIFDQLRPDGTLHYRLNAETIRQFNDQALTRMIEPKLHMLSPDQPPWDVSSRHGYIRTVPPPAGSATNVPEEVVFLREGVVLIQTHPSSGVVTLHAETFYIYPDREYAMTEQDVMIDTEFGRTKTAGLKVDLVTGRLILSSSNTQRVHTIVLPDQFKQR